ncbi:eukaryotic translation initiation factor 3 subunit D-like isoform X2 [Acanthaster planci]|uniref:Eukaryotic translation initiation factor 3 subunit D n=1 Tax=Acanthaster planci TaxID=133434 RepID=A0A8B7YH85_ACAPL|nr:eukaryotic translation initiation factor 3 subunit D-like isoform X2 [Acanthaster planci]
MSAHFVPPVIQENPTGWGPCAVPEQFKDIPYQPFSKGDRLGKVSDWTGATYQDKRYLGKYSSQFGSGNQYTYYHDQDESSFQLVDTARAQKPIYLRNRMRFNQPRAATRRDRERREQRGQQVNMQTLTKAQKERQRQVRRLQKQYGKGRQKWTDKGNNRFWKASGPVKTRNASVQVRSEWEVLEELDFPRLNKLRYPDINESEDLFTCGEMEYYDKTFDRITTKSQRRLARVNRIFHKVTTTDDPIIRKLAGKGKVFATDIILATLMCCTRSVYSWDIIVQHVGGKLFFDKRDDPEFDLLTVNETAIETPQDEGNHMNSPRNLALEATFINHNFSQQCLKKNGEKYKFDKPNPFQEDDDSEVASVGYRYRKFNIGDDLDLIVRCEHDAVMMGSGGETQFISIKTLNEWDSKQLGIAEWRQKLDSQRGAVLATELKNNSFKLSKWTVCALLSGSDQIKFGYVSRLNPRDSSKHVILGSQQFKPVELASQITLNMENCWGILRCIVDKCFKLKEGKYLILKDPMKPVVRIYDIPDNTFSSDEEAEETSSEEDEDDDNDEEA